MEEEIVLENEQVNGPQNEIPLRTMTMIMAQPLTADEIMLREEQLKLNGEAKANHLLVVAPLVYSPLQGLSLYEILMTRHPFSWSPFFLSAQREIYHACEMIKNMEVKTTAATFPYLNNVLKAFYLTPVHMIKACIVGQDPYPGVDRNGHPKAVGCCFSSNRTSEIPDSLITVYKELESSVEGWKNPGHPDITSWGLQGVLLINASLTVEAGAIKSHYGFWAPFREKLMEYINENAKDVVFLLWGGAAYDAANVINSGRHLKLKAYHPSPRNTGRVGYEFKGCNHFNLANLHLQAKGIQPIDWTVY